MPRDGRGSAVQPHEHTASHSTAAMRCVPYVVDRRATWTRCPPTSATTLTEYAAFCGASRGDDATGAALRRLGRSPVSRLADRRVPCRLFVWLAQLLPVDPSTGGSRGARARPRRRSSRRSLTVLSSAGDDAQMSDLLTWLRASPAPHRGRRDPLRHDERRCATGAPVLPNRRRGIRARHLASLPRQSVHRRGLRLRHVTGRPRRVRRNR